MLQLFMLVLLVVDFAEDPKFGQSLFTQQLGSSITIHEPDAPHTVLAEVVHPAIPAVRLLALTPHFTPLTAELVPAGPSSYSLIYTLLTIRC
jgi:hypothetical protein